MLSLHWNRMERVSMHLTSLGGVCLFALRGKRDMEKEGDKGQTNPSHPQRRDTGFKWGQHWTLPNTCMHREHWTQTHRQEGKGQTRKQTEFALWVHIDETSPSERHNYCLKNCCWEETQALKLDNDVNMNQEEIPLFLFRLTLCF